MKEPKMRTVKVNLPGGVVSIGDFSDILNAAEKAGIEEISFGSRQNVHLQVNEDHLDDLEHHFSIADVDYEIDNKEYPNIVSSYISDEIFNIPNWLHEGVYNDLIDSFNYKPQLKINIVDSTQTLVPFFTGNLNYISSDISNFWYLYVRFPKTNIIHCWSSLVYSEDICDLSKKIENVILGEKSLFYDQAVINANLLESKVSSISPFNHPVASPVRLPQFYLPCYEGFDKYNNAYWLGIYQRNEKYKVSFLNELCSTCARMRIGRIYISPWRSILIKGIEQQDRKQFNYLICKHRLTIRHSFLELNWQTEDNSSLGLQLKQYLLKQLDGVSLPAFDLSFAIKTNPKTGLFGSVVIRTQPAEPDSSAIHDDLFEVSYSKDFNPNSNDFTVYKKNVPFRELSKTLIAVCDLYYSEVPASDSCNTESKAVEEELDCRNDTIHQCKHCLSIYDESFGDEINNVAPGTAFSNIIDSYCCPICESSKKDFILIEKKIFRASLTYDN